MNYLCACMWKHLHSARDIIIPVIDFFYPPFSRVLDKQTFRYMACGGGNTLLGLVVYYISFKYILHEDMLNLGFYAFKPHIAALFMSFLVNFPTGFFLMKFVVFSESNIRSRVQLFRYFILFICFLVLNYALLKVFVEYLHIYAIFAQVMTTVIVIIFSYLMQKHFTFKVKLKEAKN